MEKATIETLYKKVIQIQRDVNQIKKRFLEEPALRDDFIERMKDIDLEPSIMVPDFAKRYGLK
ncbi:MAG: hypothetical protein Q8M92_00145 [Candidatus Subteraquimicrobiales bacterium]|nr:hypothetical protein [Candidatus Subteraquimicrobiales bacterium]